MCRLISRKVTTQLTRRCEAQCTIRRGCYACDRAEGVADVTLPLPPIIMLLFRRRGYTLLPAFTLALRDRNVFFSVTAVVLHPKRHALVTTAVLSPSLFFVTSITSLQSRAFGTAAALHHFLKMSLSMPPMTSLTPSAAHTF